MKDFVEFCRILNKVYLYNTEIYIWESLRTSCKTFECRLDKLKPAPKLPYYYYYSVSLFVRKYMISIIFKIIII